MPGKIARLTKPTDVTQDNMDTVIGNIHDKINEIIAAVASDGGKKTPEDTSGKNFDMKVIDDQSDGKVKIGVKVNNTWHTVETTGGG
tara:strand:- start:548 stop:808 length:261 start_codon:yes stop_codon:yes gene_type:complete